MNKQLKGSLILVLTAFIWGTAFVAQSKGIEQMGPFGFNAIRNYLAVIVLIPIILAIRVKKNGPDTSVKKEVKAIFSDKKLLQGGFLCGIALCVASNLQQVGIKYVSFIGKSGFLTALYIILVPIIGLFFHKKVGNLVWVGLAFALAGLYLLCITDKIVLEYADILLVACAFVFSIQIMLVDKYAPHVDVIAMSCMQFFWCATFSIIPTVLTEHNTIENVMAAAIPLIYAGVFSSSIAYTLQMVGQRDLNPTLASLIMSLEAVFSVLAGVVILRERPSGRELLGCVFMFIGVILAQIPSKKNEENEAK